MAAAAQVEPVVLNRVASRFAPEFELLLLCARPVSGHLSALDPVLAAPIHWDKLLRLTDHHRLLPVFHSALWDRDDVPASIRSAIRARFDNHQRRVLRFTAELARIVQQFDRHGIQFLAHKGVALGHLLYGDPAMRQFGDLDFLVRVSDVPGARAVLQELGYAPKLQLSCRQEEEFLRSGYEYVFGLGLERNLVEVQWQIVPRFYSIGFDMEALFARAIDLDYGGLRLPTLGREDQMLVACIHAAKHEWAQLGMVRDIATLSCFDLDWNWIIAEARRLGIVRMLALSMALAKNLFSFDSPLPLELQAEIENVREIAKVAQSGIVAGAEPETESFRYFHAIMHLRERWEDRLSMAWRLAVTPSVGEWQSVRLPDSLFSLYRGVRAFRLLKRMCLASRRLAASPTE